MRLSPSSSPTHCFYLLGTKTLYYLLALGIYYILEDSVPNMHIRCVWTSNLAETLIDCFILYQVVIYQLPPGNLVSGSSSGSRGPVPIAKTILLWEMSLVLKECNAKSHFTKSLLSGGFEKILFSNLLLLTKFSSFQLKDWGAHCPSGFQRQATLRAQRLPYPCST